MKHYSKNNPYPPTRPTALVWEYFSMSGGFKANLDYGAHDGAISSIFARDGLIELGHCVDVNKEVVEISQDSLHPNIQLKHIVKHQDLPFDDEIFDSVMILGVLEHIHDQEKILKEFKRVLKKEGELIILVPGKTLFSFLDLGNWKFVFPRIHKLYYTAVYSAERYNERYVECKNGLIGDVEVEKRWHEHFTKNELANLVEQYGFTKKYDDGRGYFFRLFILIDMATFGLLRFITGPLLKLDSKIFSSDEIIVTFKKD